MQTAHHIYRFHVIALLALISAMITSCAKTEILTFELAPTSATMYVSEELQLKAAVSFGGADNIDMIWSSSNPDVASVTQGGVVTALATGSTVISVQCDDRVCECTIDVINETYYLIHSLYENGKQAAEVWKNGELLYETSSQYNVNVYDMTISSTYVYTCGSIDVTSDTTTITRASYWRNGVLTTLSSNNHESMAHGIAVNDSKIGVVGYIIEDSVPTATYWLNGTATQLLENARAYDIAITDDDTYIVGYKATENDTIALLWKNSEATELPGNNSEARYCIIGNNDVYAVGTTTVNGVKKLALWKNGTMVELPDTETTSSPTGACFFNGILYICGNRSAEPYDEPFIITVNSANTSYTALSSNGQDCRATGVGVATDGITVVGYRLLTDLTTGNNYNTAIYWFNGAINSMSEIAYAATPVAIYVR